MAAEPTTNLGFQNFFSTTLSSDLTDSATDVFLDTVPNITEGFIVIDPDTPSKREIIYFTSKTASKVTCPSLADGRGQDGTSAQAHLTGTTVISAPVAAYFTYLKALFETTPQGWTSVGQALNYTSNDGAKLATYTVTGEDITDTVQAGMKVKLPRVTSVGTQCADFDVASSQYASRASGSLTGITFTDDFSVGGWVKIESFGASNEERTIISRYSTGVGGWIFRIEDADTGGKSAQVLIANGATTDSVNTRVGINAGEWVHIVMACDFSTDTYTAYIDGQAVEVYQQDAHTLSALVQGGDLNVGAWENANDFMDGRLKHVFVANKILSEAEAQEAMVSDDLSAASFAANLKAYYELEGNFNDTSGNGNTLTANAGVAATTADAPFSSTEYGVITSATFSTDTTVEIDFGTKVPVNENVSAPSYSISNTPYGFPASITAQTQEAKSTAGTQFIPVSETTTSTSFTDLATKGPSVGLVVPASGKVKVSITFDAVNSVANVRNEASFEMTGANSVTATVQADTIERSVTTRIPSTSALATNSGTWLVTDLTPGYTTFTVKYRAQANTSTFDRRTLIVEPVA